MLKPAGELADLPRAFLRIGPASLARHQLSLALVMHCQRIVCIAPGLSSELVQLQIDSEEAGAKFHVVTGARGLAALVTANDELVLIADGLLAPIETAAALLEGNHAVLVQPVEIGIAAGFERIDLNSASAGLMRIPGRLVERLHELPGDCNIESALTRIALQSGTAQRPLPAEALGGMRWKLVTNEGEAHAAEVGWISHQLELGGPPTPASAISRFAVRNFGPAILHAGSGGNAVAIGAAAILAIGLGLAWMGFIVTALAFWIASAILRKAGALLLAVERESLAISPGKWSRERLFDWIHDGSLLAILAWNAPPWPGSTIWACLFAPLILVALLRLTPQLFGPNWSAWLTDRLLVGLVLGGLAGAGVLATGVHLLAAALVLMAIFWPARALRITSA